MTRVFGMLFGCAIAAGLLAVGLWLAPGVKIPDEATTRAAVAPDATIPEPALQPAPPPPAAEVEEAEGPEVDILRVERDGATLVSGRATPGAEVEILLGEGTAGVAAADAQGNFVAFLTLPESDAPQSLNVRERDAEGTARPGTRNFVVETRRPAPNGLQREAAASNAEIAAARPKDEAAAVSAADVPTDTPSVPTPEVAPADDARNPSRVSLAGDAAAPQPIAPLGRSTTETQPPNSPRAARDIVAGDRPDAPDPSTEIAAASPVPHAEDAPVSTDRPDPPRAGDKSRRPAEIGIPPVQVALPQAEGAPANVPADGEMLMTRTNSPTVVDAPVQPEAPRVLRVENGSLSVVQDGAPQPALSIDTIRYAPGGTVVLGGRAPQT
ncbi:Ig-like domain-containing protein, partial [Palleronia sp.]|uniref:Ig-like domain-containing protein n=1 Tax=Palleronia sp. TaxID=1940284 RepID=UPI0035C7ED6A